MKLYSAILLSTCNASLPAYNVNLNQAKYLRPKGKQVNPDELDGDILFSPLQMDLMQSAGIDTRVFKMDHQVRPQTARGVLAEGTNAAAGGTFNKWNIQSADGSAIIVPYRFAAGYPADGIALISAALAELQAELGNCIQFVDDTTDQAHVDNYIEITCDGGPSGEHAGCQSSIGMTGPAQMMNLAAKEMGCGTSNCLSTGTIQHEFMHALGFAHEHSRPDRDSWVTINQDNIVPGAYDSNFAPLGEADWFDMSSSYDYGSVMHYSSRAFITDDANDAGLYTIEASDPNYGTYIEGQRRKASTHDILQIMGLYSDTCTVPATNTCNDGVFQVLPGRQCDGIVRDCYDMSDEGEHCICGYANDDGSTGCCTGTLEVDMGNSIIGMFDYVGWDDTYDKPYYRTKIGSFWYVLFYAQNQGTSSRCGEVGTGMWMIQRSYEKPSCVAMYSNVSPVAPIVSEAPCPNGMIFKSGGAATVCSSSPLCDSCQYGTCYSFGASAGETCGDTANNLVCGGICCECATGKGDYDGDITNGCEAEATTTTLAPSTTPEALATCDLHYPKHERTCSDFNTCIITASNFELSRSIWDLSTVNALPNMLEDKYEVKCATGFYGPTNGNLDLESGVVTDQFVNVTCLCTETNGCEWTFSNPGFQCIPDTDSFDDLCPISDIQWTGNVGSTARVPFETHSDGTQVATLNNEAIVNKNGAFVKSSFKPGKFDDPSKLANGIILFLVYPFRLSSKRTSKEPSNGSGIELRLYAGDDSKQLAFTEDEDSTIISVQIVNGITDHITNGLYTHFWFTLNGVNMSAEEHGSFRLGALPKESYDAILADSSTTATTDKDYASCIISRISKIPPFYFPQKPNGK